MAKFFLTLLRLKVKIVASTYFEIISASDNPSIGGQSKIIKSYSSDFI